MYDCEEDMVTALGKDPTMFKGKVIVIRWVIPLEGRARVWCFPCGQHD